MNQVPNPMKRPVYTFDHEPSVMELRQTAVRAMADMLSIEWAVKKDFSYIGKNSAAGKPFSYQPGNIYHGLPYASGSTALPQRFDIYDSWNIPVTETKCGISLAISVLPAVCGSETQYANPLTVFSISGEYSVKLYIEAAVATGEMIIPVSIDL